MRSRMRRRPLIVRYSECGHTRLEDVLSYADETLVVRRGWLCNDCNTPQLSFDFMFSTSTQKKDFK